ncbi:MAG TPA: ATP-binding cassette domain-containing protein, partial [Flexilinea sp.]|nr:ATP-binding cassette domain-containing protein [Flexilinea sp.]
MTKIIEVDKLSKSYGPVKAVQDISFYVEKGDLFAFLGPNGAGKSTTIDIITTVLMPDKGTVIVDGLVLGKEDDKIRSSIGVVYQDNLLDRLLTVEENLFFRAGFYGFNKDRIRESVKNAILTTGIQDYAKQRYGKISGGQRRRADITRALINTPQILFLDEPTTGLDPQTRKNLWEVIRKLQRDREMTIFLTTHYMEEAAEADYVVVIDEGKIAARGTPFELKEKYTSDLLKLSFKDEIKGLSDLADWGITY